MRASRQPPSMMELCEIFRKRKEIMLNPDQPVSELEETPHAVRSPSITPIAVNEHAVETFESGKDQPSCSTKIRRSTKTYEWRYCSSPRKEEATSLRSPVETPTEFNESEAVENSSGEDFSTFDDGNARTGPLQNQQVYKMKARNAEQYRTAYDKMGSRQRDEERIRQKGIVLEGIYSGNHLHRQGRYSSEQANSRDRSHSQANCSLYTTTRGACSPHQVQARNEMQTSRETISSSVNLQQNMLNMQLEETSQAKRRNKCSNRAVTTLPPIHQRRTRAACPHQLHRPDEQPSQLLAPGCQSGQQEFCEDRSSEYCKNRRIGFFKETDITQEHRTLVRVLQKVCEDRRSEYCKNRRIGVCKETDTTQEHRTFFRVLQKRF